VQINIEDQYNANLLLVAQLCGHKWGSRGNAKELITKLAQFNQFPAACNIYPGRIEQLHTLNSFISYERRFTLLYRDNQNNLSQWDISYAKLVFRENNFYLDAWCEQAQGCLLPELSHNACFKVDRIMKVSLANPWKPWRKEGLDVTTVQFALYNESIGLEYECMSGNTIVRMPNATVIIDSSVTGVFWFVRSILPYGASCEILSPEPLRAYVAEKLRNAANLYQELG